MFKDQEERICTRTFLSQEWTVLPASHTGRKEREREKHREIARKQKRTEQILERTVDMMEENRRLGRMRLAWLELGSEGRLSLRNPPQLFNHTPAGHV